VRNALRYTVSAKEYKILHEYLLSRTPAVEKHTPPPKRYEAIVESENDYNESSVRVALRVLITGYAGLKGWEFVSRKIAERRQQGLM